MFYIDEELASKFKDPKFSARFGKYLGTYVSDNKQVRIDLCKELNDVTAHIEFINGYEHDDVTDSWWDEIQEIARQLGYKGLTRLNYANY
jgi:hypothetical protein